MAEQEFTKNQTKGDADSGRRLSDLSETNYSVAKEQFSAKINFYSSAVDRFLVFLYLHNNI